MEWYLLGKRTRIAIFPTRASCGLIFGTGDCSGAAGEGGAKLMNAKHQATKKARKPRIIDESKEQHWREVFARFQRSELPFKKFCVQENISPNTFQYWRRELRKRDEDRGITSSISKGDNRRSKLQENIDYWLAIIEDINAYEGSVRSYCRSRGVTSGNLHFWEKRLKEMKLTNGVRKDNKSRTSQFVPVRILDDAVAATESEIRDHESSYQRIEIKLTCGMIMSLPVSTSTEVLIQLVNGVRSVN